MFRALLAVAGAALFMVGILHTIFTWNPDGWTVLAAVGVALIWVDTRVEERQAAVSRRPSALDTDHTGRVS
jgi:hypothetical protein